MALRGSREFLDRETTKEHIESYLEYKGFTKGQIDEFHTFLCDADFSDKVSSVPNICGLESEEMTLLEDIKSIFCVLWKCKQCCSHNGGTFLTHSYHPLKCAIKAKEKGYKGFGVILVNKDDGDVIPGCYGLNDLDRASCESPDGGGCPSITCGRHNGCFGRNPGNVHGCGGTYNRVGSHGHTNESTYCVGFNQSELDDCMNS